jgi:hypothetical protein
MEELDEVEIEGDLVALGLSLSPIRLKIQQLASSAITAMAGQAIQTQNNTMLRASLKREKSTKTGSTNTSMEPGTGPTDRTQLTKARVLDSLEAQRLKRYAEEKAEQAALIKMRSDQKKQEKVN